MCRYNGTHHFGICSCSFIFLIKFFCLFFLSYHSLPFSLFSCPVAHPSISCSSELSISLLAVIVIVCGLALVAVFLFLFWKLCWVPWRNKSISTNTPTTQTLAEHDKDNMADKLKDTGTLGFLEAAVKISHTSPDIPAEVQMSMKDHLMRRTRMQRQTTEPASSTR